MADDILIKFSPKIDRYKDDIKSSIRSYLSNIGKLSALTGVNCGSRCFYATLKTNPGSEGLNDDQILNLSVYLSERFKDIFDVSI